MSADVKLRIAVTGATEARSELSGLERQMGRTADSVRNIGAAGLGLAVLLPMFQNLLSGAVAMADAITTLDNRLKLSTGSAAAASVAFDDLYKAAQSSGVSFTELSSVYSTMARAGFANITAVKAIGDAMAISGGSAQGMQAALVQLGQGLASGTLRGEELNSIMEQAPRLAQAMADGLGVPRGALRKLGEEGQLTAERVIEALEKAAPQLAEEVTKSTATVSQGMTRISNSTTRLVSDLDKAVGGSAALADALVLLSKGMDSFASIVRENQGVIVGLFAAISGAAVLASLAALPAAFAAIKVAVVGLTAVLVANPLVLAFLGIGAAAGAGYGLWTARARELDTYTGKVQRLAEIEKQLKANEAMGYGDKGIYGPRTENARLRAEREALLAGVSDGYSDSESQIMQRRAAAAEAATQKRTQLESEYASLVNKSAGITKEYTESLNTLQRAYEAGLIPQAEYVRQVNELIMKTTAGKAATKDASEARRAALAAEKELEADFNRATNEFLKEREEAAQKERELILGLNAAREKRAEDEERAADDRIKSADSMVKSIERETMLLGKSNLEKEISIALWALEEKGITKADAAYAEYAKKLEDAITLREQGRKTADSWREESERIKRINDQIGQSLSDALMNGGKSAAEYLKGLFRSLVLRPVIEGAVRPLAGAISGMFGMGGSGSAFAGQGGAGGGGIGNIMGLLSNANALLSGGASSAVLRLGDYLATSQSGLANSAGSFLQGNYGAIGAGLGYAGGAMAGIGIGRAVSGGYSANGGTGNAAVNIGTIAGAFLGGPIGAAIGGAIGGGVNRLFGRKLADTGVEGSFGSGGDFGGSGYQFLKGGFFRSDKTVKSPLDEALEQVLDAGGKAASEQAKAYAEALGLPVQAVEGYTQAIKVSFNGLDEAGQKAAIEKLITDYQEGLFGQFNAQLGPLRKVGETLAQTAQRLAGLQTFTEGLAELGGVFGRVAGLTVDAREQLIGFAGGMENLAGLARGYVENYFNREEIAGLKAREIQDVLSGVGLDGSGLSSRGDFRSLVESIDVSSEAGRRQLTALLGVQGSFAGVSDFLSETGGTLGTTAASAPEAGVLGALFSDGSAAQVDAINGVSSGVATTNNLLTQLIATVQENATQPVYERDWTYEVGGA
jgi:tape measure domain-containing protein